MEEEMRAIQKTKTWELVELQNDKVVVVVVKWIYKDKHNSDGTVKGKEVRLVTKGYVEVYGTCYEETFVTIT